MIIAFTAGIEISKIPNSVLQDASEKNIPLTYAYAMYQNKIIAQKVAADATNKANAAASSGSMKTESVIEKDFYTKAEFQALPESKKNELIDSKKVFEFMKKW